MYIGPRRQVLTHRNDRMLLHAGLLLVCGMLSLEGLGVIPWLCYPPAAALVEVLARVSERVMRATGDVCRKA